MSRAANDESFRRRIRKSISGVVRKTPATSRPSRQSMAVEASAPLFDSHVGVKRCSSEMERTSHHKLSCEEQPPQQRRAMPDAVLSSSLFRTETKLVPTPSSSDPTPQPAPPQPAAAKTDAAEQAALDNATQFSSHRVLRERTPVPRLAAAAIDKPTTSLASLGNKSSGWLRAFFSGRMFRAAVQAAPTPASLTELYLAAGRQVLTPEQREAKAKADAESAAVAAMQKLQQPSPQQQQQALMLDSSASSVSGRSDATNVDMDRASPSAAVERLQQPQQQGPADVAALDTNSSLQSYKLASGELDAATLSSEIEPALDASIMDTAPAIFPQQAGPSSPPNAFAAAAGPAPSTPLLAETKERSEEFRSDFERWSDRPRGRRRALDVDRQSMSDGGFWTGAGELGAKLGIRGLSMGTFAEDPAQQYDWQRRRAKGMDQMYQQAFLPDNLEAKANLFNIAVEESVYNRVECTPVRYSMQRVRS